MSALAQRMEEEGAFPATPLAENVLIGVGKAINQVQNVTDRVGNFVQDALNNPVVHFMLHNRPVENIANSIKGTGLNTFVGTLAREGAAAGVNLNASDGQNTLVMGLVNAVSMTQIIKSLSSKMEHSSDYQRMSADEKRNFVLSVGADILMLAEIAVGTTIAASKEGHDGLMAAQGPTVLKDAVYGVVRGLENAGVNLKTTDNLNPSRGYTTKGLNFATYAVNQVLVSLGQNQIGSHSGASSQALDESLAALGKAITAYSAVNAAGEVVGELTDKTVAAYRHGTRATEGSDGTSGGLKAIKDLKIGQKIEFPKTVGDFYNKMVGTMPQIESRILALVGFHEGPGMANSAIVSEISEGVKNQVRSLFTRDLLTGMAFSANVSLRGLSTGYAHPVFPEETQRDDGGPAGS